MIPNVSNHNNIKSWKQEANQLFFSICNEEQDKLINLMHINEKKLKIYKNLLEIYLNPNCDCENEDDLEIKPERNISVITNIIFLIMILFIIIIIMTTVFLINQNHEQNFCHNNKQYGQIQIMNKQNKLDDFI
jgi:hypothetical protein